jgi:hypothetical protein
MSGDRDELVAEVNRIYWETDTPVTEMAEQLGISRRTIYDMLKPTSAAESCPVCGGDLVYPNRSARMGGEAVCSVCGRTHDVTLLHEISAAGAAAGTGKRAGAARGTGGAVRERAVSAGPERARAAAARAEAAPHRPSPTLTTLLLGGLLLALVMAILMPARRRRR